MDIPDQQALMAAFMAGLAKESDSGFKGLSQLLSYICHIYFIYMLYICHIPVMSLLYFCHISVIILLHYRNIIEICLVQICDISNSTLCILSVQLPVATMGK